MKWIFLEDLLIIFMERHCEQIYMKVSEAHCMKVYIFLERTVFEKKKFNKFKPQHLACASRLNYLCNF